MSANDATRSRLAGEIAVKLCDSEPERVPIGRSADAVSQSISHTKEASAPKLLAYVAPATGIWFFYIPMWSVLPGIYAKYFGLSLSSLGAVVLVIRLFDGVMDTATGFISDWHHARGGSRRSWVVAGSIGTVLACTQLFMPSKGVTWEYYLIWSVCFFAAFTVAEIPHVTWGNELSRDYDMRARIFGARSIATRIAIIIFYALPLLPIYSTTEYTPQILRDAVGVGAILVLCGLSASCFASRGLTESAARRNGDWRALVRSVILNKPLLVYLSAFTALGMASGIWFGLIYFYLDGYLHHGAQISSMFLLGYALGAISTPLWLVLIRKTSKVVAWALSIALFMVQLAGMWFVRPDQLGLVFGLVAIANLYFAGSDIAAVAILGDIIDYGRLRFGSNRGATYCALNVLLFKVGLGIGGGAALAMVGAFGYDASAHMQRPEAMFALRATLAVLPTILAAIGMVLVLFTPLNRRRHHIIKRRLESMARAFT